MDGRSLQAILLGLPDSSSSLTDPLSSLYLTSQSSPELT